MTRLLHRSIHNPPRMAVAAQGIDAEGKRHIDASGGAAAGLAVQEMMARDGLVENLPGDGGAAGRSAGRRLGRGADEVTRSRILNVENPAT